ncbi:ilGF domain-containing protein [Trichonephila inaurata madagascariensis]|nr:ilGF domain-containing protein [Trichonephila inaurata madagascariensis]
MGGHGNQNPFITELHSLRAALGFRIKKSPEKRQFAAVPQSGIVNECCRQQCTLTTMVSYCAVGELTGEERLAEVVSLFSSSSDILQDDFGKDIKVGVGEEPAQARHTYIPMNLVPTPPTIPFLGTTNRNRPVFVVLPQVHEKAK